MKHVLVTNAGSSSLKYKLYRLTTAATFVLPSHMVASGKIEQFSQGCNIHQYRLTHQELRYKKMLSNDTSNDNSQTYFHKSEKLFENWNALHFDIAMKELLNDYLFGLMTQSDKDSKLNQFELMIGHRVVHGGNEYRLPTMIDENVESIIKKYSVLAPLHNPFQLECIQACQKNILHLKNSHVNIIKQYAVFDTAFHSTIPQSNHTYAIPINNICLNNDNENENEITIQKYGFHGISHEYVLDRVSKFRCFVNNNNNISKRLNIISLHLGSGCSVCCIKNGESIATSMGMTPLQGLIMGTRCGDIDAGLIINLIKQHGCEKIEKMLNKESGLLSIAGTNDWRTIVNNIDKTNASFWENNNDNSDNICNNKYELAANMFINKIIEYIGSYYALLNGKVDAIVLTGGIGENIDYRVVYKLFSQIENLGMELKPFKQLKSQSKSKQFGNHNIKYSDNYDDTFDDIKIWSSHRSHAMILTLKTDEESAIANQILSLSCASQS